MAISLFMSGLRVIAIGWSDDKEIIFMHPFEEIKITFVNSVTKRPVVLAFSPIFCFQRFHMETDQDTESYYTSGTHKINPLLSRVKRKELIICSEEGQRLELGAREFWVRSGCKKIQILWPPCW